MRRRKIATPNPALDLFGEVPVLESEIIQWVAAVAPRWLEPRRSFDGYVKSYDVPGKIRTAKLAGLFDSIIEKPRSLWHARLSLLAIL